MIDTRLCLWSYAHNAQVQMCLDLTEFHFSMVVEMYMGFTTREYMFCSWEDVGLGANCGFNRKAKDSFSHTYMVSTMGF